MNMVINQKLPILHMTLGSLPDSRGTDCPDRCLLLFLTCITINICVIFFTFPHGIAVCPWSLYGW